MESKKICIVGGGSWGTTLAIILADKGYGILLWCRRQELVDEINKKRENRKYVPDVKIPLNVRATTDLKDISDADVVVIAVPSVYFRDVVKRIPNLEDKIVVSATKGLEPDTCKRMSEIIKEETKTKSVAALSGPNHSEEISRGLQAASIVASEDIGLARMLGGIFTSNSFRVCSCGDVIGVELGGALKNVVAIAVGICEGLKLGDNSKGVIVALGLREMEVLGKYLGAKQSTFYGLAGVGDLIATCISTHSRNKNVGVGIVKNNDLEQINKSMGGMIAEGIATSKVVCELSKNKKIYLPLSEQVYKILYEKRDPKKAMEELIRAV